MVLVFLAAAFAEYTAVADDGAATLTAIDGRVCSIEKSLDGSS